MLFAIWRGAVSDWSQPGSEVKVQYVPPPSGEGGFGPYFEIVLYQLNDKSSINFVFNDVRSALSCETLKTTRSVAGPCATSMHQS